MRSWLATTSFLALILFGAAAWATEDAESWQYQCLGDPVVGDRICTTELSAFQLGEEFLVYFVHVEKGKPPLVISGENEDISEATVTVDKNQTLVTQDCEDGACFFDAEASSTLMKQFRKGFRAKVVVRIGLDKVLYERDLSLRGFTAALTAPPG